MSSKKYKRNEKACEERIKKYFLDQGFQVAQQHRLSYESVGSTKRNTKIADLVLLRPGLPPRPIEVKDKPYIVEADMKQVVYYAVHFGMQGWILMNCGVNPLEIYFLNKDGKTLRPDIPENSQKFVVSANSAAMKYITIPEGWTLVQTTPNKSFPTKYVYRKTPTAAIVKRPIPNSKTLSDCCAQMEQKCRISEVRTSTVCPKKDTSNTRNSFSVGKKLTLREILPSSKLSGTTGRHSSNGTTGQRNRQPPNIQPVARRSYTPSMVKVQQKDGTPHNPTDLRRNTPTTRQKKTIDSRPIGFTKRLNLR